MTPYLLYGGRLAIGAAVGLVLLSLQRQVSRVSPLLGTVVAAGIALRVACGVGLFLISDLNLPILSQLHDGAGFWHLAPDARSYFLSAATAVEVGLSHISSSDASPTFTRALAIWMHLVGVTPVSAVLLNLLCYVVLCRLIVGIATRHRLRERWTLVPVAAFTFSPALLAFGTQPLKDTMFALLVAAGGMAWSIAGWPGAPAPSRGGWRTVSAGLVVVGAATFIISGIRAYFSVILWMAAAVMFGFAATCYRTRLPLGRFVLAASSVLVALWFCFMIGAGPYYSPYSPSRLWSSRLGLLETAREGFVEAGGDTNISSPSDTRPERVLRGLAAMLVPISALKALSLIDFRGGRGLLALADADTLFIDVFGCLSLVAMFGTRARVSDEATTVVFLLVLWLLTTLLLAYVVTNFGTLVRLRLMAATPIWLLPIFVRGTWVEATSR